jgi:hypothetical protein
MTQVWRLHVRPDEAKQGIDPTRFGIEKSVVGVDWGDLDRDANADVTAAEYEQRAGSQGYGKSPLLGWVAHLMHSNSEWSQTIFVGLGTRLNERPGTS